MAPDSTGNSASQNTPQTSASEETSETGTTVEEAHIAISQVAQKIPTLSDEQKQIIQEEIGGVLSLDDIEEYFARYRDASRTGSYTSSAFRDLVQKLLSE